MLDNSFKWVIDEKYRDIGVKSKADGYHLEDEFASMVTIDRKQQWGIANSGGIRILRSGNQGRKNKAGVPAAVFLITTKPSTIFHNPWEDDIDYNTGTVTYWGDAKHKEGKKMLVDDWDGNMVLKNIHDNVLEGNFSKVPPILYFIKEKHGYATFKGLCVLDDLRKTWIVDKGNRVINYRAKLSVLNEKWIYPSWIRERANNSNQLVIDKKAPVLWRKYSRTGEKDVLRAWMSSIRSKESQLPDPIGPGAKLIGQLEKTNPFLFERAICNVLRQYQNIVHRITKTSNVKDGGFDLYGSFVLPDPFRYPIRFKGEVKRRKAGIGPKDVSRLVARLERGEYGLFFTTSYFTRDAQKEAIIDNYPVKLVAGADLYDYFYEAQMMDENGIRKEVLE